MDGVDIIAESQTDSVLSALDRGDADDKVRDRVSAALLRAMTRMSVELRDIKTSLWKPDELKALIDERHERRCNDCPAKKLADEHIRHQKDSRQDPGSAAPQGVVQWMLSLAGNSGFQFFILLLLLISAFIYLTTGRGGVDATRETLNTVIHGGV